MLRTSADQFASGDQCSPKTTDDSTVTDFVNGDGMTAQRLRSLIQATRCRSHLDRFLDQPSPKAVGRCGLPLNSARIPSPIGDPSDVLPEPLDSRRFSAHLI
jgi:hypothetical protein